MWKTTMLCILTYLYAHADDYEGTAHNMVSGIVFVLCLMDSVPRGGIDSLRNVIPMIYLGNDKQVCAPSPSVVSLTLGSLYFS